jgi:hypothetical protein
LLTLTLPRAIAFDKRICVSDAVDVGTSVMELATLA